MTTWPIRPLVLLSPCVCELLVWLLQSLSASFGRKKWKQMWAVLVPNGLLMYKGDSRPAPGALSKDFVTLEHAALEGVDEVEAKRPFVFCVGSEGTVRLPATPCLPRCTHRCVSVQETQYAAMSHSEFDRWTQVIDVSLC